MARHITERVVVSGQLVAKTPIHVGGAGYGTDPDTDLPLARDGRGRWYMPGTSLTGALREWCRRAFPNLVEAAWGIQERASFVVVEDVTLEPPGTGQEIRDHLGVDRVTGAVAHRVKHDRAVLPRGTTFPLKLTLDLRAGDPGSWKAMLGHLLGALREEEIRLGAGKTRGLGRVALTGHPSIRVQPVGTPDGVLDILRNGREQAGSKTDPEGLRAADPDCLPQPRPRVRIEIVWQPVGPLMVKAGYDGFAVDGLPLLSAVEANKLAPVLPGSSIKGALRTQAERIMRSLLGFAPPAIVDEQNHFMRQFEVPLVDALFGSTGQTERRSGLGLGALSVDDCYADSRIDADCWRLVTQAQQSGRTGPADAPVNGELLVRLREAGLEHWQQAVHVAVDRWIGGGAESLLYSLLEPHQVRWPSLRLDLDLDRLPTDEQAPALALLFLVLDDLAEGRVPLGYAVNRGMGEVAVSKVDLRLRDRPEALPVLPIAIEPPFLEGLGDARASLADAWSKWLTDWRVAP